MINEKELNISNESYTHKDFYQIYPEILDLATKLSKRWDPTSSNESDPGVVLLKLLAFIADKNNYIIDKNILEAFMPSATQEDSMRKLCEMMGYEMSYYKSANTKVTFNYYGQKDANGVEKLKEGYSFKIPRFTVITSDSEEDNIYYTTLDEVTINSDEKSQSIEAIEGQLQKVMVGTSTTILLNNIDDNNRLYLPESMIAENGIFIHNVGEEDKDWEKVKNLNMYLPGNKYFQFGFDSKKQLPYILFPSDINNLIQGGLEVSYIRTKGINGNINYKTLSKISSETSFPIYDGNGNEVDSLDLSTDEERKSLGINNPNASTNGCNLETLNEAYNGFKKTIGTFNTLVTCRDYANAIYNLVDSMDNPLISNIQVADIRNHLTRSNNVITYNDFGLVNQYVEDADEEGITNFDLYLYPLGSNYSYFVKNTYDQSFKPGTSNNAEIIGRINNEKTISHTFKSPKNRELYCYKSYYDLNARITTKNKVNALEEAEILNNIYASLYLKFNSREVDWGEEIPFDSILKCIEEADSRIKNVSLDEPETSIYYMLANGEEGSLTDFTYDSNSNPLPREQYIQMLAKNILAGKISLFKYNNDFKIDYGQSNASYYGGNIEGGKDIDHLSTLLDIDKDVEDYTLKENEVIQFISPSLNTEKTYPAYVNYYLVLSSGTATKAIKPTFIEVTGITSANFNTKWHDAKEETGYGLYIKYSVTTAAPGFRIDDNGVQYVPSSTYNNGYTYYKVGHPFVWNGTEYVQDMDIYSEGKNTGVPSIQADEEYEFKNSDTLYINYTDTNDVVQNIIYDANGRTINGIRDTDYTRTIIKPNFVLSDSALYKASSSSIQWKKTSGYNFDTIIPGMFSLGTNEQIEIREFVEETISNKTLLAYWQVNNSENKIEFDSNDEYILNDNEYFMYTDENKTDLVILGSGTKIAKEDFDFIFVTNEEVELDDISSKGLGAFNENSWVTLKLYGSSKLILKEMDVITLAEGDIIKSLSGVGANLNNNFQPVSDALYSFGGNGVESLPKLNITGIQWKVRSRLDLNVGPNNPQHLEGSIQKVYIVYTDDDYNAVTGASEDTYINTNKLLQVPGSSNIEVYSIDGETGAKVYDFNMMKYTKVSPTSTTEGDLPQPIITGTIDNNYTSLSLKSNYSLPISIPSGYFGLIMIYYSTTMLRTLESGASGATISLNGANNYLSFYNDEDTEIRTTLPLREGINIIKIFNNTDNLNTTLTIEGNSDISGNIILSNLSIISSDNNGVNVDFLGLSTTTSTSEVTLLLNKLKSYNSLFFYNVPVDNSSIIDVDNMSEVNAMYDYNNVCNRFVISELNSNSFEKGIKLTKSSRK